ncbi:MAG: TolC family protein [Myxococcales bacterium]|nr:TolC family protein [Myxococcales bacterium]
MLGTVLTASNDTVEQAGCSLRHALLVLAALAGLVLEMGAASAGAQASPRGELAGGSQPLSGRRLDYSGALARARRAPQAVLAALAEQRSRAAGVNAANAAFLPRLSLSASAAVRHQEFWQPPPATGGGTQAYDAAAVAELTLFDFGRRSKLLEAAQYHHRAAVSDVGSAQLQAQLAASDAYLRAAAARRMTNAFTAIVERRRDMLRATERLVAANVKPEVDVQRAMLEVVSAEADLTTWRNREQAELAALSVVLAMPVDGALTLVPASDQELAVDGPNRATADVRCADPLVMAARARAKAAASAAESSDRAVLPVLSLQARSAFNRLAELYGSPAPPPFTLSATSWEASGMLSLRWDGLDATLWHQAASAGHAAEAARHTLAQTVQQRELLVHQTTLEVRNGRARLSQQARAVQVARRAFAAQDHRYREGLASTLELLDVRDALDRAEVQHIAGQLELDLARGRLRLLSPGCPS